MKLYCVLEKDKLELMVCGSIKSVSVETGLNLSTLSYQFSRMGRKRYDKGKWLVQLVELKRVKRVFKFKRKI